MVSLFNLSWHAIRPGESGRLDPRQSLLLKVEEQDIRSAAELCWSAAQVPLKLHHRCDCFCSAPVRR